MKPTSKKIVVVLLGLIPFGCDSAPPKSEPPPPKVSVGKPVVREMVDYDQYNGWLQPVDSVDVRSRVRGHLDKIHFTDGDMVKKDQLLFELDPRPLQAEIDRSKDQVKIYQAQYDAAKKEDARLKELVKKGGASQSQADAAEAEAISLEAQIDASKQEVKRRELELEYSQIKSPLNGRIGRSMLSVGNLVNAGGSDPVLTTIVSIDPIQLYFDVDERALQRYSKSRATTQTKTVREEKIPITFGLETDEGFPNKGVIDFANNQVDSRTGTIQVRAIVANPGGKLIPGSRARIRLPVGAEQKSLLIPDSAILSDQDRRYVLAIDDKNVVQRRDVRLGKLLDDGSRVILASEKAVGIKPDDWIIFQGIQTARLNYPVEPIRPATQPTATTQPTAAAQ